MKYFITILLFVFFTVSPTFAAGEKSIFDRIRNNNTIKCGYAEWPKFFDINANTGEFSGFFYDFWHIVGQELKVKIDWVSPIAWGQITEAVSAKKIDLFCNAVWPDAGRRKNMLLSNPVILTPLYAYIRSGDKRFENKDITTLDSTKYKGVALDGDASEFHLDRYFPHAEKQMLTASSPYSELILSVVTEKADFVVLDESEVDAFLVNNPDKIRKLSEKPVTIKMVQIPIAKEEYHLLNAINGIIRDFINDGTIKALLKKHKITGAIVPSN